MKLIGTDSISGYDVDNTLVMWDKDHDKPGEGKVAFVNPYSQETVYLTPHKVHCRMLKEHKQRGDTIIVWSGNGGKWAETVVKTLLLDDYVDFYMTKFRRVVDDKDTLADIVGHRIYLEDSNQPQTFYISKG